MDLLTAFKHYIHQENLFRPGARLLVAVSGGVDSVVLCELCHQAGYDFEIAHCNFRLRGEESERDESFVRDLADGYGRRVWVKHFDTAEYARQNKLSVQVAARMLRYEWFETVITGEPDGGQRFPAASPPEKRGLSPTGNQARILTAHHADDNVETVLMNFLKGSGIAGLRGIMPEQGKLVRPLLFADKATLVAYAAERRLAYVEDSSNASDKYTRNLLRNHIIPEIKKIYPAVEANISATSNRFRGIEQIYLDAVGKLRRKLVERKGDEIHLPVLKLKGMPSPETLLYEITKEYGFTPQQLSDICNLLDSNTGKYVQSPAFRIIKNRSWLIISPNKSEAAETVVIGSDEGEVPFREGLLVLKQLPQSAVISDSPKIAALDGEKIIFPLILRKRRAGDYFYPLGMKKKKKLSRFLSDLKLSLPEKEKTWVLEMDKKIIWVIGHRIDERFKISGKTNRVFRIEYKPNG